MGGDIPGGNFLDGNFPGAVFQRGVWWVGIFPGEFSQTLVLHTIKI